MTRNRLANLNCDWLELCNVMPSKAGPCYVRRCTCRGAFLGVARVHSTCAARVRHSERANVKVKKYGARLSDSQRNCNYVTARWASFVCQFVCLCLCLSVLQTHYCFKSC